MCPIYEYRCSAGHTTDIFRGMKDEHPTSVACEKPHCHQIALRVFSLGSVIPDFPEHFNVSIGEVVKSRAHLKQIQRERGLQDYEPCRNSPGSQLVNDRLKNRGRVVVT